MKKRHTPSYFYKILILFLITVLTTSIVLTIFSYRQFSNALTQKVWADYQAGLRKNAQTWNDLVSEMGQLRLAITVDPQTENFFSMKSFDPIVDYNAYLKVKKLFNINPYMESFCLYNETADYAMYCGNDAVNLEELWTKMLEHNEKIIVKSEKADDGESLLVFGYPIYIDSFDSPQGAVFLCINEKKAASHVFGDTGNDQAIINLPYGVILGDDTAISQKSVTDWINNRTSQTGNEILCWNQEKYLCSFYQQGDMIFFNHADYEAVMEPLRKQRNIFLLFCLAVMALSALVQFAVVKNLYRPIASIKKSFETSRFADSNAKSEFDLIRQVYEGAVNQIQELEEKNALYLPRMKADILRGLLTGSLDPEQAQMRLKEHGWELSFSGMFLVSIQIDQTPEDTLMHSMVQTGIRQIFSEELDDAFFTETIPRGSEEVIGLINTGKEQEVTFETLIQCLERVRDRILNEYEISMTIGLDGVISEASDCPKIYKKVRLLLKNRFSLGENQVIYPRRVMNLLPEPLTWPDKLIQEILIAFSKGDRDAYILKTEDFLDIISQYEYASTALIFARLMMELIAQMRQNGAKSSLFAARNKLEPATRKEARQILDTAFNDYLSGRQEAEVLKSNKHYKKIMMGQQYILEHFSDCTMSVDQIAEGLGYSTNYFARLFKSITGYYINDYIRQVRIMKAQELLQNTEMTVNEIAEATGFTTSNYFYSIFKKETGMTPATWRNIKEESKS